MTEGLSLVQMPILLEEFLATRKFQTLGLCLFLFSDCRGQQAEGVARLRFVEAYSVRECEEKVGISGKLHWQFQKPDQTKNKMLTLVLDSEGFKAAKLLSLKATLPQKFPAESSLHGNFHEQRDPDTDRHILQLLQSLC